MIPLSGYFWLIAKCVQHGSLQIEYLHMFDILQRGLIKTLVSLSTVVL